MWDSYLTTKVYVPIVHKKTGKLSVCFWGVNLKKINKENEALILSYNVSALHFPSYSTKSISHNHRHAKGNEGAQINTERKEICKMPQMQTPVLTVAYKGT